MLKPHRLCTTEYVESIHSHSLACDTCTAFTAFTAQTLESERRPLCNVFRTLRTYETKKVGLDVGPQAHRSSDRRIRCLNFRTPSLLAFANTTLQPLAFWRFSQTTISQPISNRKRSNSSLHSLLLVGSLATKFISHQIRGSKSFWISLVFDISQVIALDAKFEFNSMKFALKSKTNDVYQQHYREAP